ncbi:MAG: AraC family transcriptional regulator [Lachnospiraceae bacterium]|nr:AraC family transcriptional regulator [Lachnospiraceae bacterium]
MSKRYPSMDTLEKRIHSNREIPYSVYNCDMPRLYPNVPIHWHNEYEIDYVIGGVGEFVCGDEHFVARKGDVILSLPNMIHAAYPEDGKSLTYQAFVFNANMLGLVENDRSYNNCIRPLTQSSIKPVLHYSDKFSNFDEVTKIVSQIMNSAFKNNACEDLLLKSNLYRLFWIINKEGIVADEDSQDISYAGLIRPSLEYMAANFNQTITIEMLASLCSLSTSYFMSSFKKAVGFGAIEYLNHLRIREACNMLADTTDDVSQIASSCGYNNLSNFNRQFKKLVGCSPRDYRTKEK